MWQKSKNYDVGKIKLFHYLFIYQILLLLLIHVGLKSHYIIVSLTTYSECIFIYG